MSKNIILCGVGGQGTVLASKLLAYAAMAKNLNVMSAETIGMAQKGGSVFSYLRIGNDIHSPMIGRKDADIIIGFEPAEAVRMLPYLREDGTVIVSSKAVIPVTASLSGAGYDAGEMLDYLRKKVKKLIVVDADKACSEIGTSKVMNLLMLGVLVRSGAVSFTADDIKDAVRAKVNPKFHELNFRALDYIPERQIIG